MEESRDKVIKMLSIVTKDDDHAHASDQDLKIVSIVGVGGLGKTTLAKTVHDMLKKQFGSSAFISVGRTPSLTRTFEKMLVDLDEKYSQVDMSRWDAGRFSNELHKFLQQKRCFIVVDDIWDVGSWEAIKYDLRDNNCGSTIIMTTSNLEVVTKVEEVYRLKPLSDRNSMKLFYKRIQSHEGESLDGVSGEGFIHLDEKQESSLFEVGERYFKELVNRSMIQPMDHEYNYFTQYFRIHDIVFDLIRKLSSVENFITILDSRDQHASLDKSGNEKKTRLPHLDSKVRRLAVRNHHLQCFPEDTMDMPEVLRSLNIEVSKVEIMAPLHRFRLCRVLHLQKCHVPISLKHIGRLLHIKYLDISNTIVDELPKELGHLRSLLTLVLINIGVDELPPAVCSLTQLMCLVAKGFKMFPADRMGNLTSLEELQLHTVVSRSTTKDLVVELGKLTRLRVVTIHFSVEPEERMQKALVQSLYNLRELQELVPFSSEMHQPGATIREDWEPPPRQLRHLFINDIIFTRQPGWINCSFLPRLYFLYLVMYVVEVQDLDNLARLPELTYLQLGSFSWPPGYTVCTDGFRNLRSCDVGTTLKFHVGAMPRLEVLEFVVFAGYRSWEKKGLALEQFPTKDVIEDLDLGLDNLLSLEKVIVTVNCSGATAAEVQEVEALVTHAVENHPNRPTIIMDRVCEHRILSDEDKVALLQQHIELHGRVLELKDKPDAVFISDLRLFRHLQNAVISIDCAGASMCEVEKLEAVLRHAIVLHRNHPTIQLIRTNTDEMVSSSDHPDTELDDDYDDSPDNLFCKLQLRN